MKYSIKKLNPFGVLIEPVDNLNINQMEIRLLRDLFAEEQLLLLRGFHTFSNSLEFAEYCEKWGEVSLWPFGKVLELVEHDNPTDHIFDNSYVPLHWDGMYRLQVPEYQIFHCVKAPLKQKGGRTTFSNTSLVLQNATKEMKDRWGTVKGIYKRKMEFYNSKTVSPIIVKHPFRDYPVIRYNEVHQAKNGKFVNPPDHKFEGMEDPENFHESLIQSLYSPNNYYAHEWQNGDVVIADNFTLLHGREAFESKSPRHIQRVHVLSNPPLDNIYLEEYK